MNIPIAPEQVMLLGFLAALLVQGIKLWSAKAGKEVNRKHITLVLFVLSVPLAYLWARPAMPDFPSWPVPTSEDPAAYTALIIVFLGELVVFLGKLVAVLASIMGFATAIYNLLLEKVFNKLGWTKGAVNPQLIKPIAGNEDAPEIQKYQHPKLTDEDWQG